jgi:hypothetical protein
LIRFRGLSIACHGKSVLSTRVWNLISNQKDHSIEVPISDFRPNEAKYYITDQLYIHGPINPYLLSLESGRMTMTEEYPLENLGSLEIAVSTPLPASSTLTLTPRQSGQASQPALVEAEATFQDHRLGTEAPPSSSSASNVSVRQRRAEFSLLPVDQGYGAWSFVSIR